MRILALDTTTESCSAALLVDTVEYSRAEEPGRGHADRILKMVDEVLAEGQIEMGALDAIAACIGPGAFTGARISVAVAQGLAFGARLPVIAVSSLEALAFARMQRGAACVLACLDARMHEVYWAAYRSDPVRGVVAVVGPAVSPPADVVAGAACVGTGRGFSAYPELLRLVEPGIERADLQALPDARAVAALGALRFAAGEGILPGALRPLYLRDNVALTEAQRGVQ